MPRSGHQNGPGALVRACSAATPRCSPWPRGVAPRRGVVPDLVHVVENLCRCQPWQRTSRSSGPCLSWTLRIISRPVAGKSARLRKHAMTGMVGVESGVGLVRASSFMITFPSSSRPAFALVSGRSDGMVLTEIVLSIHAVAVTRIAPGELPRSGEPDDQRAPSRQRSRRTPHRSANERQGDGHRDDDTYRHCLRVRSLTDVHGFPS